MQVGQLLLAHHALRDAPSGASPSTSAFLQETRVQYERIMGFFKSLHEKDASAATESLRQLFQDNLSMMSTLQDASMKALEHAQTKSQAEEHQEEEPQHKPPPHRLVPKLEPVASMSDGTESEAETESETGGRASVHEEAAAQALTGLRQLTPRVSSAAAASHEKKLQATNAAQLFAAQLAMPQRPPSHHNEHTTTKTYAGFQQQQQPQQTFGGSVRSPLSITAPQPQSLPGMGSPIFHQPIATPSGSLPSIFSRPLLAPLGSPVQTHDAGMYAHQMLPTPSGMISVNGQLAAIADWKSVASSDQNPSVAIGSLNPKVEPSPTSVTPVTTGYYRQFSQSTGGQTSPMKRKSITSKQLMATPHTGPLGLPPSTAYAIIERSHPVRKANPRRWTKEEDEALRHAVESHREKNWKAIAAEVPGRNHTQCLQRWTKVLAPGLVKGHWSPQEDDLLRRLVASEQKNWGEVAAKIPGRTSKQCRERWHNHLDPSIVRGAYTPEEDRIILEAQARLGNRWSVIAAMLPGRTEDAVKIRWKSHCRVWRARKYLRKSPSDQPGGVDHDKDDEDEDSSDDDESLSGMETPLAMTPMTPGYGHQFAWPTAPTASPTSTSNSSSSSSSNSGSSSSSNSSSNDSATTKSSSKSRNKVGSSAENPAAASGGVAEKLSVQ